MARPTNDSKLIADNPGKTARELLALGLSQAGYEKLATEQEKVTPTPPIQNEPEPAKPAPVAPIVSQTTAAVPKLRENPAVYSDGSMVDLISPDGKRTRMTRTAAERFKRHGRNANYSIEG